MTLAGFLAECAAIEARIPTTGITHDDVVLLRQAVYAWRDAGQPASGPLFEAFRAAAWTNELACTRALEIAVAESQRRALIERLQRELDELNREEARDAAADAARRRRQKYEIGTAQAGAA